jgi:predicted DNA-binding transcriptional regulator YafY
LQAVIHFIAFPNPPLDFDDARFVRLQEAIHRRQVIHLRYHAQHSNEVTERDVEPMELAMIDKTWVLMAYCRLRQGRRAFRLDRMDKITFRPEHFTPRDLGDPSPRPGPQQVVVHFDTAIVRWVRERQHYSLFEERPTPDGIIMVYQPRALDQLENWLLSWGDKMEVLEPAELRQRLAAVAASILDRHQEIGD